MTFNYFAFHNECWDILSKIRDNLKGTIINDQGVANVDDLLQLACFLLMNVSQAKITMTKSQRSFDFVPSRGFTKAAEVVEEMLSSGRF